MAEAMLIPGATQVFADVLEGKNGERGTGDVKKLFKNMEQGKYTLQDIVKVLETMDKRVDPELLKEALDNPAAALRKLETTWQRTLVKLNKAGTLDLMISGLEGATKLIVQLGEWIDKNKQEIKEWSEKIISTFKWIISNLPLLTGLWMSFKLAEWFTAASAGAATLNTALSGILLRFVAIPILVGLAIATIMEFYDTLNGKNTLTKALSEEKDKGLLGWLAAMTRTVLDLIGYLGTTIKLMSFLGVAKITGNQAVADALIKDINLAEATFFQHQKDMGITGSTPLEDQQQRKAAHMEKFNAYLAYKERAVDTSGGAFSMVPARYRQMSYDAQQQTQPTTFSPTIQINTTSTDPEKHAQLVTVAIEDWYTKKMFTAASNYSPTPSLNN
jgi:hypothetical protein